MLDIYAGSLTRYYARDWKTHNQQIAESMGVEYRIVGPAANTEEDGPRASSEEIEKAVAMWSESLLAALSAQVGVQFKSWTDTSTSPYFTAQLTWQAFNALILWGAFAEFPDLADAKPDYDDLANNPAYVKFADEAFKSSYKILTRNIEMWLPCAISFAFVVPTIAQRQTQMASVMTMKQQLEALNAATWKADAAEIESWTKDGTPPKEASHETLAKYCFARLMAGLEFCTTNNLPMMLDY